MKEQLRQKEEQLQAKQQQASMLSAELRDASSARDRTMADLYRMRLETDALQQGKQEALAQCSRLERLVKQMKDDAQQEAVRRTIDFNVFGCVPNGSLFSALLLTRCHRAV